MRGVRSLAYHARMSGFAGEIVSLFQRGGPVMWPLFALSVLSVAITIERLVFWLTTHTATRRRWLRSLTTHFASGDRASASALLAKDGSLYAGAGRALMEAPPRPTLAVEVAERYRPAMERFATMHATIITAAPLLGILGTVLGIIDSFDLLGLSENVTDISAVAAGIAQALITTAFGLIVALVTLFPHMFFRAHTDRGLSELELLATAYANGATGQPA